MATEESLMRGRPNPQCSTLAIVDLEERVLRDLSKSRTDRTSSCCPRPRLGRVHRAPLRTDRLG